jgi:putative endonuclease
MTKTVKRQFGDWGESQACSFLVRQGYEIMDRNFYAFGGEIDIIARLENKICFIEVKTRTVADYFSEDSAERAVDWLKLKKMTLAAKEYCFIQHLDLFDTEFCFEEVVVYVNRETKTVKFKKYLLELS